MSQPAVQEAQVAVDDEVQVAVDDEQDDSYSEIGTSIASSSTSLLSSLREYQQEHGRTYHRYKEGKYNMPNDDKELDRLDFIHALCRLALDDKYGLAPPNQDNAVVGRVLDVGTGTGIWAIEFGEEHPEADILGVDLSATQPGSVPSNVRFEVDDIEDEWIFSQPFQYIHCRYISGGISDWSRFIRRCYENLEPGGYLEIQETDINVRSDDGTLKPEHALSRWGQLIMEAFLKLGAAPFDPLILKDLMVDAGFEDVSMSLYKFPTNTWPKEGKFKELGMWNHQNFMDGVEAVTMAPLTRALEWTPEEVSVFLIDVRKNGKDRSIHGYWPQYIFVGRKPEEKKEYEEKKENVPAPAPAPA
ncbi:Secondary metabolism regulator LAE1 [Colletotrichum orbiculare MAFF 240422]|uniref:Secondary metabolism regulator LAE1 n=1 Tax=Colletotrichum orbiculare (strain 104-T / ATCC 96160 / CBS 514.97 / LARS 414 / MAFF 240422) TaxID=1213857 RepID=A0A484FZT4_COLOR|nr:Secondary metabolism regulator LAE1 [Colletotrichum orbiculare MAFF 240422]